MLLFRSYSDRPRVLGCDECPAGALQCLVPSWWGRKRRSSKRSIGTAPVGRHLSSSTTHLWSDAYVSVPNNKMSGPVGINSKEKRICVFHADGRRNFISLRNRKKLAQWNKLMIPHNSSRRRGWGLSLIPPVIQTSNAFAIFRPLTVLMFIHSFIQYSVWRQVQSLLQNDASI